MNDFLIQDTNARAQIIWAISQTSLDQKANTGYSQYHDY